MSNKTDIRHEGMRIGGEKVFTDKVVEVKYPYTDEVIGTVPAGTAEHARKAFEIAAAYKSKLSRYERSKILQRTGELIGERRDDLAKWLTLELGICHQHAIYETKRAQDVYQFAAAQAMASRLNEDLGDGGEPLAAILQKNAGNVTDPAKDLEARVKAGPHMLRHDGNPVMTWMMSNVNARVDKNDNVFPNKLNDECKIDGPVALITAMSRAMVMEEPDNGYHISPIPDFVMSA